MELRAPPRALDFTLFFFFFFLLKVRQTTLKSVYLSQFVPSVILGRIRKSPKMDPRPSPFLEDLTYFKKKEKKRKWSFSKAVVGGAFSDF